MPKYWLEGIFEEDTFENTKEYFIYSEKYCGSIYGYSFKHGEKGLGYYMLNSV